MAGILTPRPRQGLLLTAFLAALPAGPLASAGPEVASPRPATQARNTGARIPAGEFTLQLQRVTFRRTSTLSFGPADHPAPRKTGGSAEAVLDLNVSAPDRSLLDRLAAGDAASPARCSASDDRGRPASDASAQLLQSDAETTLRLTFRGLSPAATALSDVQGEFLAYPAARRVRLHLPWLKDEVPLSVEFDGAVATLRRFQLVENDSTLWVSLRPPDGFRLAADLPNALRARAVDIYGNWVDGGGIARTEQTRAGSEPEFRFSAPGLSRVPSRLMLDALCVAGEPRPVPFRLGRVSFPGPGR